MSIAGDTEARRRGRSSQWRHKGNNRTRGLRRVDFQRVAEAALSRPQAIVSALLPGGKRLGTEWVALNPTRPDRSLGSLKVSLTKGCWADFALGVCGHDLISLAAYVGGTSQYEACVRLAEALGLDPYL